MGVHASRSDSVVLDASDADKFPQHVIVHLSGGASLVSVAQAKAVCAHVIAHMPRALTAVATPRGAAACLIDQAVYNKNQQMRIQGCVKLGSSRVLRIVQPQGSTLDDTLVCMPQQGTLGPGVWASEAPSGSVGAPRGAAMGGQGAWGVLHADVVRAISSTMGGCHITGCALHAVYASNHPSLFVYTTSTACAHTHTTKATGLSQSWTAQQCAGGCCAGMAAGQGTGTSCRHARSQHHTRLHGCRLTVHSGAHR